MLKLTRRINERIIIDGNIVIRVLSCKRNSVQIGIEVPKQVPIVREELLKVVNQNNVS